MVSFILLKVLFWLFVIIWLGVIMFGPETGEGELTKTFKIFFGIIAIALLIVDGFLNGQSSILSSISSIISSIFFIILAIAFGCVAGVCFKMGREYYKNLIDNEVATNYVNKNDTPKEKNLEIKSILSFVASLILAFLCWVCLKNAFL